MRALDAGAVRRLLRSRDFLADHLDAKVRLADAAGAAALSDFHFHRSFARAFGETPHDFLTRLRIDRARQLLATTETPVTDICLAIGYESLGSFSTMFRARTGLSPAEYRRSLRRIFPASDFPAPHRFVPNCFLSFYSLRCF